MRMTRRKKINKKQKYNEILKGLVGVMFLVKERTTKSVRIN